MILVLQPDVEESFLDSIRKELEALGCTFHPSRGDEQVIVALGGNFDPFAVHAAAAAWPAVDAVSLRSDRYYHNARRNYRWLTGLIIGFGLLTIGGLAFPVLHFLRPPDHRLELTGPVRVGAVATFEPGTARRLRMHGHTVMVARDHAGRFHAVSGDCTHIDPCQLDWDLERQQLLCPCHGGVFDVLGNVVDGPANAPLLRFETTVVQEALYVNQRR